MSDDVRSSFLLLTLVVWGVALFGGFALGRPHGDPVRRMPAWTRLLSSAALVVAGWAWVAALPTGDARRASVLIAVGMTLGFIGDLFLAEVLPLGHAVLAGMAAFGAGHVAYALGLLWYGNQVHLDAPLPRFGAWGVWLLVGIAGWYVVVYRDSKPTPLHWAALPYALLLASTTGIATGLALQSARFVPVAIGAAFFLASDLLLAAELFNRASFPLLGDVVWLLYGPGQMLIVYGAGTALLALSGR